MDQALKRVAIVAMLLIFALMVNVNYIQGGQADQLKKNKKNARQYADIFGFDRGKIMAGEKVLAYTKPLGDQKSGSSKNRKYQRVYNDGAIFSPVTGFFSGTGLKSGLEQSYDSLLDGRDNRLSAQSWLDSIVGKKAAGADVYTTIDPKAQLAAYNKLKVETLRRGAAVVIDIRTGAIKVAASYPSFDTNSVAGHDTTAAKELDRLDNETKPRVGNDANPKFKSSTPFVNKALSEVFPPGSSFKAVVASAFLQDGHDKNTLVPAPFEYPVPGGGAVVHNDAGGICGSAQSPLIGTFAESCNTTYALLGLKPELLGPEKVAAEARKYGFYQKIKVENDLFAPPSLFPDKLGPAEIFRGSFGQGETKATPLQMAMVASGIANNGTVMKPYLVDDVKTKDETLYSANRQEFSKPLSSASSSDLREMMREVVRAGTAKNLNGTGIAGKTGTAELDGDRRGLWFVGFYPSQAPKYGFAIMIEGTKGDFGATKSGPVAVAITQALQN
jgi:peptidoglycan glycosyltransferase